MAERLRLEHVRGDDDELTLPRRRFVRTGVFAGAGLLFGGAAGGVVGDEASARAPSRKDRRILRFLLHLEYLQADFYSTASDRGRLRGELREFAEVVGAHEREHVALLERRVGASAGAKPRFDFGKTPEDPDRFAQTARRLEELTVAAHIGQGANLSARTVATVARITSVEARHAAWIADFLGSDPAPLAADKAQTSKQVLAAIRRLGFEA